MKDKRLLIIAGLVAVLLIAIPLTVYIANQQQEVRSNAQVPPAQVAAVTDTPIPATNAPTSTATPVPTVTVSPTTSPTVTTTVTPTTAATGTTTPTVTGTGGSCQAPATVSGVEFNFPSCQGTQCDFTQANCSWAAVNGAVSYSVTVTQVDTGSVISTTTVTAPTVSYSFPVTQGQTYKCDIVAVNACGGSGPAGSVQALCAVDGQVSSPQPTQPTVPPQVIPTVVATGDTNITTLVGIGGVVVAILGGVLFFFSGI